MATKVSSPNVRGVYSAFAIGFVGRLSRQVPAIWVIDTDKRMVTMPAPDPVPTDFTCRYIMSMLNHCDLKALGL